MKKISRETIIRSLMLLIGVINTVCVLLGWNPLDIDESAIYDSVSAVYMVAVTAWAWWKNNSFTHAAISADSVKETMKNGISLVEAVEALTDRRDPEDRQVM